MCCAAEVITPRGVARRTGRHVTMSAMDKSQISGRPCWRRR